MVTTQQFELPANCPTCQAMRTVWNIDRRYVSYADMEQATYKCGCRIECYLPHRRHDIREECPKSPGQVAALKCKAEIDAAVAETLMRLKLSKDEAKGFCKRADRSTWSDYPSEGLLAYMTKYAKVEDK